MYIIMFELEPLLQHPSFLPPSVCPPLPFSPHHILRMLFPRLYDLRLGQT